MGKRGLKETSRHLAAFEVWYTVGRSFERALEILHQQGDRISSRTLYRWAERFEWHKRADLLDKEAARRRMEQSVREQIEMLKRKAGVGRMLQKKAIEFLQQNGITSPRDALYALRLGFEMEQNALGLPEVIELVMGADDEKKVRTVYEAALAELAVVTPEIGGWESAGDDEGEPSYPPIAIAPIREDDGGEQ